jgi:hypothetical protein
MNERRHIRQGKGKGKGHLKVRYDRIYDMIYLLTAIGLTPGGSIAVHIYTQTIHGTTHETE